MEEEMKSKSDLSEDENMSQNEKEQEKDTIDYEDNDSEESINDSVDTKENRHASKKHSLRFKVLVGLGVAVFALLLMAGTYLWHILGYYNQKDFSDGNVVYQEEKFDTEEDKGYEKADPESIIWQKYGELKKVEGVTNILLFGEENQDNGSRGRADVIIIATIDTNNNSLKLTSIMRDTYVQIPGYRDNRINSSYRTGDVPLLEETIKENFNIEVDGYIKVDFDSFTEIIDALGGVEVTLSAEEAEWLNDGNHIRDKNSRNLTAGTHILNGSQALGYSRIRYVRTPNGLGSDFGRIWRQKHILLQVFNKYKDQSILDILDMAPDILKLIQTDYSKTELLSLVKTVMDLVVDEIETFSIPVKNGYSVKDIRGMDVLIPDLQVNIDALNEFIYGNKTTTASDSNSSSSNY